MPDNAQHGVHAKELDASPEETLRRVASLVEAWGGEWQAEGEGAGKLILPVSAGVRRGWMGFLVSATPSESDTTRLELRVAEEHLQVDRATVVFLLTALAGALLFLVVPFVPKLMPLLPVGFLLTAAGWLVVASRLRNSGVEEFVDSLDSLVPSDTSSEGGGTAG